MPKNRNNRSNAKQSLYSDEERASLRSGAGRADASDNGAAASRGSRRQRKASEPSTTTPPTVSEGFSISGPSSKEVLTPGDPGHQRFAMDPRSRKMAYLALGFVIAFVVVLIAPTNTLDVNNQNLSLAWVIEMVRRNIMNITTFLLGGGAYGGIDYTIWRYLIVALAGAALSVSGAAYQGSLKNQLASPSTLGVLSGAQLGAVIFILVSGSVSIFSYSDGGGSTVTQISESVFSGMNIVEYAWATAQQGFCALAGSAVVVAFVLLISRIAGGGDKSRFVMVVAGQMMAALVSSAIVLTRMYIQVYGTEDQLEALTYIMTGGFGQTFTLVHLCVVGVPIVICIAIILLMRKRLNLLAFNEEEARSMGISVKGTRVALVACCTILTAVVVAFCGPVGFIGFLVPHMARRIVGPDFNYLIPASALFGALLMIVVFCLFLNLTIPSGSISTVTTAVGTVAFVIVLVKQRRSGNASW